MPANDALRRIRRELAANPPVNVVLASRQHGEDEEELERLNIGTDLQTQFLAIAQDAVSDELRLVEYTPGYKPDEGEISWIDLEDAPSVQQVCERISNFQNLVVFDGAEAFLDRLKYYALFARVGTRRAVTLFRATSAKLELGRGRKVGAILRRGQYDTIEETIFLFDRSIDCWTDGRYMFIQNISNFERVFRYFEQLQARAEETVARVMERIPIANGDAFRQACTTQARFMTKIAVVAQKPYFDRITMNDVRRAIREHQLDIEIVRENGRDCLRFDPDPTRRWILLKLLDDDYLNSVMTNSRYEANSKLLRA